MKPENVLKIHELIMEKYDKHLLIQMRLAKMDEDNFAITELMREVAMNTAPTVVSGDYASSVEGNEDADDKIMKAAFHACKVAFENQALKNADEAAVRGEAFNGEEYRRVFRESFEAALRIELYRQFIGQVVDIKEIVADFVKDNARAPHDKQELIAYSIDAQARIIDAEFKKFEKAHRLSRPEQEIIGGLKAEISGMLASFKKENQENAFQSNTPYFYNRSLTFQIEAQRLIAKYQIETMSNKSWAPLLMNLLLMISGIGTIPAMVSLAVKAKTGQYAFFDSSNLKEIPAEERSSAVDQLIGSKLKNRD